MEIPVVQQNASVFGYGLFWLANSITATIMGFANRDLQKEAVERNEAFMMEMEQARTVTEDLKAQEEIAFKRRLMKLSRQYHQTESATAFSNRMKGLELKTFFQKYWSLDVQLPYVLLNEIETSQTSRAPLPLNVILLHSPLLPVSKCGQPIIDYATFFKNIEDTIVLDDIPCMGLGDVRFRKNACVKTNVSGSNANIMNIHFVMSQLPTLVISHRYHDGKLIFSGAVWESQAARPAARCLFSLDYGSNMVGGDAQFHKKLLDLYHASVSTIIGTVRDSYMLLTQGKEPTFDKWLNDGKHDEMKSIVTNTPQLHGFIEQEYNSILSVLNADKTPALFQAYSKEDVRLMREKIQSINI